jgi:hypothetical protein
MIRADIRLSGLLTIVLAGPAFAAEAYPDGVEREFADWTVICDTVHTCQAQAFAGNYARAALVLRREAGPEAKLTITLERADGGDVEGLVFDEAGRFAEAFAGATIEDSNDFVTRLAIADAHIATFIAGLRNATELAGGNDLAISLAGASAALRLIDDVQGRADTFTALISKGDKPASAVPPAPSLPIIKAPTTRAYAIEDEPDAAVKTAGIAACGGYDEVQFEPIGTRLSDGREIWLMPCSSGMYNFLYAGLLKDGSVISDLAFTGPKEGGPPAEELSNLWNPEIAVNEEGIEVPDTPLIMTTFGKGRSLADCGTITKHVWTGDAFALVSNIRMNHCIGLPLDEWPTRWQADVVAE